MILPLCRPDVLVMDFVDGEPLTDSHRLDAGRFDRQKLGTEIIDVNLQLILFNDVFHADPHPGNYLVTPDGRLAMLDFGQIGHSTPATRAGLLQLLTALVTGDIARTAQAVGAICGASPDDTADLGAAVSDLFTGISTKPLAEAHIGTVFHHLLSVLDHHHLVMPAEMTMLIKAIVECEATAGELYPGLKLTEIIPLAINRPRPPLGQNQQRRPAHPTVDQAKGCGAAPPLISERAAPNRLRPPRAVHASLAQAHHGGPS